MLVYLVCLSGRFLGCLLHRWCLECCALFIRFNIANLNLMIQKIELNSGQAKMETSRERPQILKVSIFAWPEFIWFFKMATDKSEV